MEILFYVLGAVTVLGVALILVVTLIALQVRKLQNRTDLIEDNLTHSIETIYRDLDDNRNAMQRNVEDIVKDFRMVEYTMQNQIDRVTSLMQKSGKSQLNG
jgi:predicted PurR-regulated permease PerM